MALPKYSKEMKKIQNEILDYRRFIKDGLYRIRIFRKEIGILQKQLRAMEWERLKKYSKRKVL